MSAAVVLYSSRSDAHDWLAGETGAWRRAMRALQTQVDQGKAVEVEVVITRPAASQLPELAHLLSRMRPASVMFRLPNDNEVTASNVVMILPRFPLFVPLLEAAVQRLEASRIACAASDLPSCAGAPAVARKTITASDAGVLRCAACDPARCCGVRREYVETFGWDDLQSRPATGEVVVVRLETAMSSRAMRMELARVAATGARTLRLEGSGVFAHPDAPSVLADATHLSFERVEAAGEASGLERFTDGQLARLKGITVIEFDVFGPTPEAHDRHLGIPDAWDRTQSALMRLHDLAGVPSRPRVAS